MIDPKIRTLIRVIEEGSFTRAAAALHLTQPAVSHHIRQLEAEYGIPIFRPDKKELVPTPEGAVLIKYARRALRWTVGPAGDRGQPPQPAPPGRWA